jgi:preprotein translocase subunit YajC
MPAYLFILVLLAVLWLFLIRPRQRQLREQRAMLAGIEVGDEIVTAGGLYGTVTRLDDDEVRVEIAPELEVRIARRAIAGVLTEKEAGQEELEPGEKPEEGTKANLPG